MTLEEQRRLKDAQIREGLEKTGLLFSYVDKIDNLSDKRSTIEVLRVGVVRDRGLVVTEEMLDDYVANWEAGVYGTEIQVDLRHDREGEAGAWVKRLYKEDGKLLAEVEWTPLGEDKVAKKLYRYTSSELAAEYPHWKTGEIVKNVFVGVALTNIPAMKGMEPISLSEKALLFFNSQNNMDKLKKMFAKFSAGKASKEDLAEFKKMADEYDKENGTKDGAKMFKELADHAEPDGDEGKTGKEGKTMPPKVEKNSEDMTLLKLSEDLKETQRQLLAEKQKNEANTATTMKLQETIARKDLAEQIKSNLILSENRAVGIKDDPELVKKFEDFAISLSEEQRKTMFELFAEFQNVDLKVRGGGGANAGDVGEDAVLTLAEQLFTAPENKGKFKDIGEAQKAAQLQLKK